MLEYRIRRGGKSRVKIMDGDLFESFPDAWNRIIKRRLPTELLAFSDSFMKETDSTVIVDGSLVDDFSNNPESEVKALLSVCGVNTYSGQQHHIFVPYGYDDYGAPTFGEPFEAAYSPEEAPSCRMADLLAVCVASVHMKMKNRH